MFFSPFPAMYYRHAVGVIGLILLGGGIFFYVQGDNDTVLVASAGLRVGIVSCLAWLAWPELSRLSPIMVVSVGIGVLIVARWPRLFVVVAPIIVALWFLQPRKKKKI